MGNYLQAIPRGKFQDQVDVNVTYLDHPDHARKQASDIDPRKFQTVPPENARYVAVRYNVNAQPDAAGILHRNSDEPVFFGIKMEGSRKYMRRQANEIAHGLFDRVGISDEASAITGLLAAAKIHTYVAEMNAEYRREHGNDHPHITPGNADLMAELGALFKKTAEAALNDGLDDHTREIWSEGLRAIRERDALSTPAASTDAAPGDRGMFTEEVPAPRTNRIPPPATISGLDFALAGSGDTGEKLPDLDIVPPKTVVARPYDAEKDGDLPWAELVEETPPVKSRHTPDSDTPPAGGPPSRR